MTAEIIDFNLIALQRLSNRATAEGNVFEAYAMKQLIDGSGIVTGKHTRS